MTEQPGLLFTLMTTWYSSESFSHPALENLKRFKEQPEPFLKIEAFYVAVIGMVLARSIQGTLNGKPIIFLSGLFLAYTSTRYGDGTNTGSSNCGSGN